MKCKLYKNNIEIDYSDITRNNSSQLSLIFEPNPQDKAETCIDHIKYSDGNFIVFDYDSDHIEKYKKGTSKFQDYIRILENLGFKEVRNDIANFDKTLYSFKRKGTKLK